MATIEVDVSGVGAKVDKIKSDPTLGAFAATQAQAGMEQYVPKRSGWLRSTASTEPWAVNYTAPYAAKVYHGSELHFTTPGTGAYWDKAYTAAHKNELAKAITAYLKR